MKPALWYAFLGWSLAGLFMLSFGLDPAWVRSRSLPEAPEAFLLGCLHWGDFLFILLAFANVFQVACEIWGKTRAIRAAAAILGGSALLETVGTLTGQPFGFYAYTSNFGPRLGVLPLAIPLAWFLMVAGFRLVLDGWPPTHGWPRGLRALAVGACATGFDWILEPFAWQVRSYWLWLDGAIPLQNYGAWFAFASLFAAFALPRSILAPKTWKTAWVLALMLFFFACGRLAY
jgi:uncharacterized membrane protein